MPNWSDPKHPCWQLARFAILMAGLTVVLYHNASNFDHTEWKAIGEFAVLVIAANAGRHGIRLLSKSKGDQ